MFAGVVGDVQKAISFFRKTERCAYLGSAVNQKNTV